MNLPEQSLSLASELMRQTVRRWLLLGVAALGIAGIFAGMLANTKSAYFYTALVAHVDLSVLVWFLSFSCLLMTMGVPWGALTLLGNGGFYSAALGAFCIAASAFAGGVPFQNNYIPVIYHPLFFLGVALLFCGVMCVVAQLLLSHQAKAAVPPVRVGVISVASILLMAVFCFLWSYYKMPKDLHGQGYYEQLFWAGGHVLQIAYAQVMIIAWLWLAEASGLKKMPGRKWVLLAYAIGVLSAMAGVVMVMLLMPGTTHYHEAYTMLMRHANGLPALIVGVLLVRSMFFTRSNIPSPVGKRLGGGHVSAKTMPLTTPSLTLPLKGEGISLPVISLVMSILLFTVGGMLGYLIMGSTVTTPAHYHGSIVGVTLSLMGLAYVMLPKLGFAEVAGQRLAKLQPIIYGGGQLFWMTGMAIGGAEGVGRKIPGTADVIGGMGGFLKHAGDGLSLIGGLLFVFVVVKAVIRKKTKETK